jgi:tetratricopeptide (TPR) repeat protein
MKAGISAASVAWNSAVALLEGGKPAEAEKGLRRALASAGDDADLQLLLAVTLLRQARPGEALTLLDRLAAMQPTRVDVLVNHGNALLDLGRAAEAEAPLVAATRQAPDFWQAFYFLGLACERGGNQRGAAEAFARTVTLAPAVWDARLRLIAALRLDERPLDAAAAAREALAQQPDDVAVRHDLAMLLGVGGRPGEALVEIEDVLRRLPGFAEAWNTLGNVLGDLKRGGEGLAAYRKALVIAPGLADGHYNIANRERMVEDYADAERRYLRALSIAPEHVNARNNLAATLLAAGRVEPAITAYQLCLRQLPGWHDAAFNLGMAQLLLGDMRNGLANYESRWHLKAFAHVRRNFPQPLWDGSRFAGRRLLLHAEQGAGDTLQFVRYVPMICERGGEVLLESPGSLARLLSTLKGGAKIFRPGEMIPPFDMHLPLGSAMRVFGTEVETIPGKTPYLWSDAGDRERWRQRLAGGGLKVGITWQGNPDQGAEPHRSIALERLRPLLETSGCRFFALQKEFGREQMAALPPGVLDDLGPELADFAETAAAIMELDLVISTCTSVVHLVGALGKPVWVLLRFSPDWRWLLGRGDSPWYPTARLFRQKRPGDWFDVVRRVSVALKEKTGS